MARTGMLTARQLSSGKSQRRAERLLGGSLIDGADHDIVSAFGLRADRFVTRMSGDSEETMRSQ
jgi:hypothetical protein